MGIYDEPYLLKHAIAIDVYYNNPTAHTCKRNNTYTHFFYDIHIYNINNELFFANGDKTVEN